MCSYEILDQFFDRLDTLISMFRLKGKTPSFTEISSRIESLTDRYRSIVFFFFCIFIILVLFFKLRIQS